MKKSTKIVTGTLIGLPATAVISVGFSSWIINQTNTAETGDITVAVADVTDKSVLIENAQVSASDNSILFDADKDDNQGRITYGGDTGGEDLHFTITYTLKVGKSADAARVSAYLSLNAETAAETAYTTCKTGNYFVEPISADSALQTNILNNSGAPANYTADDGAISTTVVTGTPTTAYNIYNVTTVLTYKWGDAFGSKNPSIYADEKTGDVYSHDLETVVAALQTLKTASTAKLKVTLTSYSTAA